MRTWPEDECCPYCGETVETAAKSFLQQDELEHGLPRLECPVCGRDGCAICMPGGNNCMCPECEEGGD